MSDIKKHFNKPECVFWQSLATGPTSFWMAMIYGSYVGLSGDPLFFKSMIVSFLSVMTVGLILGIRVVFVGRKIFAIGVLFELGKLIVFAPPSVFLLTMTPLIIIIFIFTKIGDWYKEKLAKGSH